ncbi:MerR family transcriptional regulator [Oscillospiraceae bacterium CM]|nr:MerR family transcriptional regulator [Oscillospiraceae bacterium CM]
MKLTISQTAKLTGISVRTLHYYDEIGLLKPTETTSAGYRYYDGDNLALLQQILFYRELAFPLKEIIAMVSQPDHDRQKTLKRHRHLLMLKRQHLDELLRLVDETLGGDTSMTQQEAAFTDYEAAKAQYAAEAKARWGHTDAYRESAQKEQGRTKAETAAMMEKAGEIFRSFAEMRGRDPSDPDVQALVRRWQAHITEFHYRCTDDILACLGEMYVEDARFRSNIDRYGDGTAQLMSDAIKICCSH